MQLDGGYRRLLRLPFASRSRARTIVGGEFEAFGLVESEMLRFYGLTSGHVLVDVGCGPGRLTNALHHWFDGLYIGIDVVPAFLREARTYARDGWRFVRADGLQLPMPGESTDFVCFFSVLTHLPHERSFLYLKDASRALRPGGTIVFSFLEYREPSHWLVFEKSVEGVQRNAKGQTTNVFITRSAISRWASALNLEVFDVRDGSDRFVPLPHDITLDNGTTMSRHGCLGQSIAVLRKPFAATTAPSPRRHWAQARVL
jgi:2-polyprenyl-3-methyl-5-hydroxy-6-metoxy-1,4-benzoquinol methylase